MSNIIATRELGTIAGFEVRAHLEPDLDASPEDYDCFDQADIDAWKNDQWEFVGVVVTASKEGIDLGTGYIGAVVHGQIGEKSVDALEDEPGFIVNNVPDPDTFASGYGVGLVSDAIAAAKAKLAELNK